MTVGIETIPALWPLQGVITAGTTLRPADLSADEHRDQLSAQLDCPVQWLQQAHGNRVHIVNNNIEAIPEADAVVVTTPGLACAVLTADCLPVLLTSPNAGIIAAVHAGWRGLANGVIAKTVAAINQESAARGADAELVAWLGPAISAANYEVDDTVRQAIVGSARNLELAFRETRPGHYHADLYDIARRQLQAAGVEACYGGEHCTLAEPERFFSFRRDKSRGRMATFIALQPAT